MGSDAASPYSSAAGCHPLLDTLDAVGVAGNILYTAVLYIVHTLCYTNGRLLLYAEIHKVYFG